jgi:N-glycosidase YbiA
MARIEFYGERNRNGYLSNFYRAPIVIDDVEWPTSEHFFQAQKFVGPYTETIRLAETPGQAKRLGQTRRVPLRDDWERVKDQVMLEALMVKFTQHEGLKRALLETGDATLVEHTRNDRYWGDAGDGSGRNMLGILLMQTRNIIRQQ